MYASRHTSISAMNGSNIVDINVYYAAFGDAYKLRVRFDPHNDSPVVSHPINIVGNGS